MIKYVLTNKDGYITNNSDVEFEGATKVIFQDDWETDFNRFYDKFRVNESNVVLHPDNLPTDPITNQLNDLASKAKDANQSLEQANTTIDSLTKDNKDLSSKLQTLTTGNSKAMNMISYMYGSFAEFQHQLQQKQDKDQQSNSNASDNSGNNQTSNTQTSDNQQTSSAQQTTQTNQSSNGQATQTDQQGQTSQNQNTQNQ